MANKIKIKKRDTVPIVVNVTSNVTSSKNTTFTTTRVTDGSTWDLSQVVAGMQVKAENGSVGTISVVDDSNDYLDVSSWDGGTPYAGERVTIEKVAIDITGYTFFLTVKSTESDPDASAIMTKDVTSHTDATNGQTTITLSTSDTNVTIGDYYYDIQMKDGSDNITTLVKGDFSVVQDITVRTS